MSERKNIDKLFQEKFKDFEMDPPENTWPELEKRLKKEKDRKIIPFWWRLSGIAAALVIGFLIGNRLGLFDSKNETENSVATEEHSKENKDVDHPNWNKNQIKPQDAIVGNEADVVEKTAVTGSENKPSAIGNESNVGKQKQSEKQGKATHSDNYNNVNDALVNTNGAQSQKVNQNASGDNLNQRIYKKNNQKTNSIANRQTAVAGKSDESTSQKRRDLKKPNQLFQNQKSGVKAQDLLDDKPNTAITQTESNTAGSNENTTVPKFSEAATNQLQLNKNSNSANPVAVAKDTDAEKKLDSTAIAAAQPNALEELLHEKENKVAKEQGPKLNRWQITSNVAPIYFGSTSGGSPIDSTFANKSKDYNTQMGYGIGLSYAVNKRLTIRTGVNKVSLDYDTKDVQLYAGLNEGGFRNLDTPAENEFLNFSRMVSDAKSATGSRSQANLAAADITTDKFTGSINQKMGYIEVPVEVSYAVINNTFGVNVIAGVSTLFLNENEVMLSSEGYKTNLGKANNLNTTHFSTNVGLGIKYTFLKSFEAKFEPIFKYQLNTFSKDNGDFKPFFFGLYTGLSFRF